MSRVGFKKVIAATAFDNAALQSLFSDMRSYIVSAGFEIIENVTNDIEFTQAGSVAGVIDDDVPHWWISSVGNQLNATSIYGVDRGDQAAYQGQQDSPSLVENTALTEMTVHFAADGIGGWWWLHVAVADQGLFSMHFARAGTTSRRYPVDHTKGLVSRYGIRTLSGSWYPPYGVSDGGVTTAGPFFEYWSPLGPGAGWASVRHQGSPLPRLAVPEYPHPGGWNQNTACLLGEFNEILALTDGYTHAEAFAPGWVALVGVGTQRPYAALAPTTFTVL